MAASADDLAAVAQLANEEFARDQGVRFFDVPARQLFEYDARGALAVRAGAEANRRLLAQLALDFRHCEAGAVSLRRSLKYDARTDAGLLYVKGARVLLAVRAEAGGAARVVSLAFVTPLTAAVLEPAVLRALGGRLPCAKGLYLALVCAEPKTGGATYLLLRLLGKLARQHTGVLAHAVNAGSRAFLARHGYAPVGGGGGGGNSQPRRTRVDEEVLYLSRAAAVAHVPTYLGMLRTADATRRLCTRRGLTRATAGRTYWDCR